MRILYSGPRFELAADGVRQVTDGDIARVSRCLSPGYAKTLVRKNRRSTDESVSAALLLLDMLSVRGREPSEVIRGEQGKPFFRSSGLSFSLSHDGGAVICALSDAQVGADLMALPVRFGADRQLAVARRFFTPEEAAELERASGTPGSEQLFAEFWTEREAVSKRAGGALGDWLGKPLPKDAEFYRFVFRLAGNSYLSSVCL